MAAGATLSQLGACSPAIQKEHLKNWAGNLEYSTGNVHYPKTVEQVQEVVKKCNKLTALVRNILSIQ